MEITLFERINELRAGNISGKVNARLAEFKALGKKRGEDWFSELCFCILTANSKARTAIEIQNELGCIGFLNSSQDEICSIIRKHGHRFHNNKSRYICEARQFKDAKNILSRFDTSFAMREWIVKNVKGVGYKEASHFLRNVGFTDLAILDRHILNLLAENKFIDAVPKPLNKKSYFEIEKTVNQIAEKFKMSTAELDLYMWYMKAGDVLK